MRVLKGYSKVISILIVDHGKNIPIEKHQLDSSSTRVISK